LSHTVNRLGNQARPARMPQRAECGKYIANIVEAAVMIAWEAQPAAPGGTSQAAEAVSWSQPIRAKLYHRTESSMIVAPPTHQRRRVSLCGLFNHVLSSRLFSKRQLGLIMMLAGRARLAEFTPLFYRGRNEFMKKITLALALLAAAGLVGATADAATKHKHHKTHTSAQSGAAAGTSTTPPPAGGGTTATPAYHAPK
jgi:hypothetical protein